MCIYDNQCNSSVLLHLNCHGLIFFNSELGVLHHALGTDLSVIISFCLHFTVLCAIASVNLSRN